MQGGARGGEERGEDREERGGRRGGGEEGGRGRGSRRCWGDVAISAHPSSAQAGRAVRDIAVGEAVIALIGAAHSSRVDAVDHTICRAQAAGADRALPPAVAAVAPKMAGLVGSARPTIVAVAICGVASRADNSVRVSNRCGAVGGGQHVAPRARQRGHKRHATHTRQCRSHTVGEVEAPGRRVVDAIIHALQIPRRREQPERYAEQQRRAQLSHGRWQQGGSRHHGGASLQETSQNSRYE